MSRRTRIAFLRCHPVRHGSVVAHMSISPALLPGRLEAWAGGYLARALVALPAPVLRRLAGHTATRRGGAAPRGAAARQARGDRPRPDERWGTGRRAAAAPGADRAADGRAPEAAADGQRSARGRDPSAPLRPAHGANARPVVGVLPRRRLGPGLGGDPRRELPAARTPQRRPGPVGRLPARARASLPRGRRGRRWPPTPGRPSTPTGSAPTRRGWPSAATARAATSRRSSRSRRATTSGYPPWRSNSCSTR